ncbi:aminotransferase class I/II-fold pyridoxal phosphate-dependent enzyme [Candidatus Woesearchaeota archaeon]|nr:aminotransferase class I/II-fold pyridoxal phosphate-dependent enzyme [Candidatus Woesearchaeota archaeon]
MEINSSDRIKKLTGYAFDEVDKLVKGLKEKGVQPIDFGVGDPQMPTPSLIRDALKRATDDRKSAGYPSYIGDENYRNAIADWTKRRFGVDLDPAREITSNIGSKEAIFNFAEAFVNPGDYVLVPNPGYPPYERGTLFAEGRPYFMNLTEENCFFPDLTAIPDDIVKKSKIIWVNYPNNPTTAMPTKDFYKELIDFGHDNNIIIASDNPYSENYYDEKPISILEMEREGIVEVQSLSKRSNMTCYRVGWLAGDENVINVFKKLKTNIDSGTPTFVQDAAVAALEDESHVEELREDYRIKRDMLISAMDRKGLPDCTPAGTIYIWQKVAEGMDSVEFAKKLLDEKVGIVTTPGNWISSDVDGVNPGQGYVRFALVPPLDEVEEAVRRFENLEI